MELLLAILMLKGFDFVLVVDVNLVTVAVVRLL
jgi:hypothetical protein